MLTNACKQRRQRTQLIRNTVKGRNHLHQVQNENDLAHFLEVLPVHYALKEFKTVADAALAQTLSRDNSDTHGQEKGGYLFLGPTNKEPFGFEFSDFKS